MFLEKIIEAKRDSLRFRRGKQRVTSLAKEGRIAPPPHNFYQHLREKRPYFSIIAEIKRRSPSKGDLNLGLDPIQLASSYEEAGADAISILTEPLFFGGSFEDFQKVRQEVELPLLRKDFLLETWEVEESHLLGADLVLLIASILDPYRYKDLFQCAQELGLNCLVEVHNLEELEKALSLQPPLIGINNRNLKTFEVDLQTTLDLRQKLPSEQLVISESGILGTQEIQLLKNEVDGFLIGEYFVRHPNPQIALQKLIEVNES